MKNFILVTLVNLAISEHAQNENRGQIINMDHFNGQIISNRDAQTIGSWKSVLKPSGGTNGQIISRGGS